MVSLTLRARGPPRPPWGLIYVRAEPHPLEAKGRFPAFLAQPCSPGGPGGESGSREWEGGDEWPWGVVVLDEGPLAALRPPGCCCTLRMDRGGTARSGDAAGSHSTPGLARCRDEPSFSPCLSPSSLPPGPSSLRLVELQLPDWPPGGADLPTQAGQDRQVGASPSRAPGSIPGAGSGAPGLTPDWGRVQDALWVNVTPSLVAGLGLGWKAPPCSRPTSTRPAAPALHGSPGETTPHSPPQEPGCGG